MRRPPLTPLFHLVVACVAMLTGPARAAAPLPPVAAFFGTPHFSHVKLSPDGRHVAMAILLPDGSQGIAVRGTEADGKLGALARVDGVDVGISAIDWSTTAASLTCSRTCAAMRTPSATCSQSISTARTCAT